MIIIYMTFHKTWKIDITFQEIAFQYEDSCIVMDQFEGNATKFCLVIKISVLLKEPGPPLI